MKNILLLIVSLLVIEQNDLNYVNSEYGYSFTLPKGWKKIPSADLEAAVKQVNIRSKYEEGFYKNPDGYFAYPYILTQRFTGVYSEKEFQLLSKETYKKMSGQVAQVVEWHSDVLEKLELSSINYDSKKKISFFVIDGRLFGDATSKIIGALLFGKKETIGIYLYTYEATFTEDVKDFEKIVDKAKIEK